jgi:hypothetical protein
MDNDDNVNMYISYGTYEYNYNLKFQLTVCVYMWAEISESVQRLATGRTDRGTIPVWSIISAPIRTKTVNHSSSYTVGTGFLSRW